ncbi:MAG: hypothetical protein FWF67_07980 [Fibromonadales bacterium]|nr:hypothetical protein [Fibromonadales bacterium]
MRTQLTKIALAASISLALVFTFGCGGSKPAVADDGFSDIANPADELLQKCIKEYPDHFCGVGEAIVDKPSSAGDIALVRARAEITNQMKVEVTNQLVTGYSVDPNDHEVSASLNKIFSEAQNKMANVITRDSKTQYNKQENKYRVYRLASVPKADAFKFAKDAISSDQALMSTATAAATLSIIDNAINKLK